MNVLENILNQEQKKMWDRICKINNVTEHISFGEFANKEDELAFGHLRCAFHSFMGVEVDISKIKEMVPDIDVDKLRKSLVEYRILAIEGFYNSDGMAIVERFVGNHQEQEKLAA